MFRILKRCSIGFNLDDVNRVRKILFLKPIKKIATDWEVNKQYFSKSFFDEKGMFKESKGDEKRKFSAKRGTVKQKQAGL
jgi:hypothetical protein